MRPNIQINRLIVILGKDLVLTWVPPMSLLEQCHLLIVLVILLRVVVLIVLLLFVRHLREARCSARRFLRLLYLVVLIALDPVHQLGVRAVGRRLVRYLRYRYGCGRFLFDNESKLFVIRKGPWPLQRATSVVENQMTNDVCLAPNSELRT